MFCRKCGKNIPNDSDFCTFCGTKVIMSDDDAEFDSDFSNIGGIDGSSEGIENSFEGIEDSTCKSKDLCRQSKGSSEVIKDSVRESKDSPDDIMQLIITTKNTLYMIELVLAILFVVCGIIQVYVGNTYIPNYKIYLKPTNWSILYKAYGFYMFKGFIMIGLGVLNCFIGIVKFANLATIRISTGSELIKRFSGGIIGILFVGITSLAFGGIFPVLLVIPMIFRFILVRERISFLRKD